MTSSSWLTSCLIADHKPYRLALRANASKRPARCVRRREGKKQYGYDGEKKKRSSVMALSRVQGSRVFCCAQIVPVRCLKIFRVAPPQSGQKIKVVVRLRGQLSSIFSSSIQRRATQPDKLQQSIVRRRSNVQSASLMVCRTNLGKMMSNKKLKKGDKECTTRTCVLGHWIANEGRTSTYDAPIPIVAPTGSSSSPELAPRNVLQARLAPNENRSEERGRKRVACLRWYGSPSSITASYGPRRSLP